jgi:CheY-like chemotaxis protein
VLTEVQILMEVRAKQKSLTLALRCDGTLPESIQTDRTRLRQILINLVSNAIKFTQTGGVEMVARFFDDRHSLQVDVIDTGIGIAQEHQQQLFQRFTQADATSTRKYGGTGLGLTITKRLVEMLEGTISFESEVNKGTTFRVTIPVGLSQSAAKPAAASLGVSQSLDDKPLFGRHVLVVDDREEIRYLLTRYITEAGGRVDVAAGGQAAIDAIRAVEKADRFDVVILDIQMPGMDGYEVSRRLRAGGLRTPIIALTAGAMVGDRERCLQAGIDDYLTKPIDRLALVQMVARHARKVPQSSGLEQKNSKILLVDDSQAACSLLANWLESRGHAVRAVYDGKSALHLAQEFHPDVVLLDIRLPDMNGYQLMQRLRDLDGLGRAIFIALSGYGEDDAPGRGSVEFDYFIQKPLNIEQLDSLLYSISISAAASPCAGEAISGAVRELLP